jgi:hypothetical protein
LPQTVSGGLITSKDIAPPPLHLQYFYGGSKCFSLPGVSRSKFSVNLRLTEILQAESQLLALSSRSKKPYNDYPAFREEAKFSCEKNTLA